MRSEGLLAGLNERRQYIYADLLFRLHLALFFGRDVHGQSCEVGGKLPKAAGVFMEAESLEERQRGKTRKKIQRKARRNAHLFVIGSFQLLIGLLIRVSRRLDVACGGGLLFDEAGLSSASPHLPCESSHPSDPNRLIVPFRLLSRAKVLLGEPVLTSQSA
jgi:hypothetical protein